MTILIVAAAWLSLIALSVAFLARRASLRGHGGWPS